MEAKRVVFFANNCNIINYVCSPYIYVFDPGVYLLEVWGASGGNASITHTNGVSQYPTYGGKGGYSNGTIRILQQTNAFIYVGEKGFVVTETNKNSSGTFGGGNLTISCTGSGHGCIGGGASDIRLNSDSLYSRVIVAGGGGGTAGGMTYKVGTNGGDAGGKEGYKGFDDVDPINYYTIGATQETGGKTHGCSYTPIGFDGEFGLGGGSNNGNGTNYGGSGGGGWFGGAGGAHRVSGSGGSGYAFNETSYKPPYFLLSQSYYLTSASVLDGKAEFPIPSEYINNYSLERGHIGNGAVRITYYSAITKPVAAYSCRCQILNFNTALLFTLIYYSS
jgi:hypothetical protein